jgi:hypothetical protein
MLAENLLRHRASGCERLFVHEFRNPRVSLTVVVDVPRTADCSELEQFLQIVCDLAQRMADIQAPLASWVDGRFSLSATWFISVEWANFKQSWLCDTMGRVLL